MTSNTVTDPDAPFSPRTTPTTGSATTPTRPRRLGGRSTFPSAGSADGSTRHIYQPGHRHVARVRVGSTRSRPRPSGVLPQLRTDPDDRERRPARHNLSIRRFQRQSPEADHGLPHRLLRPGCEVCDRIRTSQRAPTSALHTRRGARDVQPHFDQLGHLTGELVLDGERITIDCHSVRDRTWGPRGGAHLQSRKPEHLRGEYTVREPGGPSWRQVERQRGRGRIQYIFGHAGAETGFLSFVRPQDGNAAGFSPLNVGWLLKEGRFERLDKTRSRMRNYRDPRTGWSAHMEVELVDVTGRSMEAEGFAVSHMCEHGTGSNALMRWEFDGKIGWGEDQDGWKPDHFAELVRALRDTGRAGILS